MKLSYQSILFQVLAGKKEFDLIEEKIEDSIDAIKPKVNINFT